MRRFGVAVMALLAGLVVGTWPYRKDLQAAREEITRLKTQAAHRERARSNMEGITRLLAIPDREEDHDVSQVANSSQTGPTFHHSPAFSNHTPAPIFDAQHGRRESDRPRAQEDFRTQIQKASELWKTRVALARESFVSRIPTNEQQVTRFDVLVEAMNIRLETTIEKWVDIIKTQENVTAEIGVRMMNELTDAIVVTYDELDRNMPPNWREKAGSEFQLIDFVDPEVAMPLAEIAPKIEAQRPFQSRGQTNRPPFVVESNK